jgi:predicted O-methyltransferase YrrM
MGKRWDVTKGDSFMVLDKDGKLIRGVIWADESSQIYWQVYVHAINAPLDRQKRNSSFATREGYGPFTVVPYTNIGDRSAFLVQLARQYKWTTGAEIGTNRGVTTCRLLSSCPGLHMTVVDLWVGKFASHEVDFWKNIRKFPKDRYNVIKQLSHKGADLVVDASLDFVFIDAGHAYESCSADIVAWLPKVKPTGMLLGHDANWDGVEKAYTELLKNVSVWRPDEVWYTNKADQVSELTNDHEGSVDGPPYV